MEKLFPKCEQPCEGYMEMAKLVSGVAAECQDITGLDLIRRERVRQVEAEGYNKEHDDHHVCGELAVFAAAYALIAGMTPEIREGNRNHTLSEEIWPDVWAWCCPFDKESFKFGADDSNESRIKELTKAGALIVAEIDRLLRRRLE